MKHRHEITSAPTKQLERTQGRELLATASGRRELISGDIDLNIEFQAESNETKLFMDDDSAEHTITLVSITGRSFSNWQSKLASALRPIRAILRAENYL